MSPADGSSLLTTFPRIARRAAGSRWAWPFLGLAVLTTVLAPVIWLLSPGYGFAENVWFRLAAVAGPVFWASLGVAIGAPEQRAWSLAVALSAYLGPIALATSWPALYSWDLSWFVLSWPLVVPWFAVWFPSPET